MKAYNYAKYLSIFLWLVALHSFLVGLGLILMPGSFLTLLGYGDCTENFFRSQGGVFHIAMSVGYAMAAYNQKRFECLVIFTIFVKFAATVFLFSYSIFINSLPVIVLSGISDFIMAMVILFLYSSTKMAPQTEVKND